MGLFSRHPSLRSPLGSCELSFMWFRNIPASGLNWAVGSSSSLNGRQLKTNDVRNAPIV